MHYHSLLMVSVALIGIFICTTPMFSRHLDASFKGVRRKGRTQRDDDQD